LISIIIPVLNEQQGIVRQLKQLQHFREQGHEIIVVDGGSHDKTLVLATPFVDHVLHSRSGRAYQMNFGASHAQGDLLLFQHCDSDLPDQALSLLERLPKDTWGRFDVRLTGDHPMFRVIAFMMNWRSRLTGIATGDQSIFVSRLLFEKIGGFPEQPLMEDIELSTHLKKQQRPVCLNTPLTTSSRRWQKKGIWQTILLMWRLRLAYFFGAPADQLVRQYYPSYNLHEQTRSDSIRQSSHPRTSKNPLDEPV
jgi:rSAM/selenodomain-associated transferase 2